MDDAVTRITESEQAEAKRFQSSARRWKLALHASLAWVAYGFGTFAYGVTAAVLHWAYQLPDGPIGGLMFMAAMGGIMGGGMLAMVCGTNLFEAKMHGEHAASRPLSGYQLPLFPAC